ncbi:hypothetical protein HC031_22725 [Planosporangium thailandense]|uniref:Uncharacterized protein n=1 Tax=Planosporangium thailandense TaxID=765197 RepID=A0ABX0Y2B7_9ACTN|nr:hypothetical protein [Planosporangium thailandense]NJC72511.1 hypothetical protein [Planosporangium thailandense]
MAPAQADRRRDRSWPAAVLDHGEYLLNALNAAVAVALAVGGVLLFGAPTGTVTVITNGAPCVLGELKKCAIGQV